jgi:Rad3-related DNA helicase
MDPTTEVKTEYTKEQQMIDQEKANAKRAREEAAALRQQLADQQAQSTELRKQFNDLSAQVNAGKSVADALPEIDPENASVADLAGAIKKASQIIADQAKELATLKNTARTYAEESAADKAARRAKEQADAVLNEVCDELEKEFGAGYRNEAITLMKQKNEELGTPSNPAKAALRLRDCYREIKTQKDKNKGSKVNTDTGGGGYRPDMGQKPLKKGSLDDVAAQVAARPKSE